MVFHGHLGTGSETLVHPVAGLALLGPLEGDALDDEFPANPRIEINPPGQDITSESGWGQMPNCERSAYAFIYFHLKKGYLALVMILMIKVAIPQDASAFNAAHLHHLHGRTCSRWLSMMTNEVVFARDEDVFDQYLEL